MKSTAKKAYLDNDLSEELDVPVEPWTLDELGDLDDLACLPFLREGGDDVYA